MTSGLAAILERIRSQPQNEVLLDRFLLLVADMEDSEEKATVLLEFVSVIRTEYPKFALQILRQVYRQVTCPWVRRPQELAMQSLQVLHDTMLAMGRNARAGLIANEMQRLRENPLPAVNQRIEDRAPPPHVEMDSYVEPAPKKKWKLKEKSARARIERGEYKPPRPAVNVSESLGIFEMPQDPPTELPEVPLEPAQEIPPVDAPIAAADALALKDVRKLFRMFDAYNKDESEAKKAEPVDIVPVVEISPAAKPDIPESLRERLFGTTIGGNDSINDPLVPHILQLGKRLQWHVTTKDAKRLAVHLRDEQSPLWLVSLWFLIGTESVQQLFRDEGVHDSLEQTWSECIAFLVERQQFRRALIFLRVSIDADSAISRGNTAFQFLPQIWNELYLRGFSWQAQDGMPALANRLARREEPLFQGLIVI